MNLLSVVEVGGDDRYLLEPRTRETASRAQLEALSLDGFSFGSLLSRLSCVALVADLLTFLQMRSF